MVVAPDGVRLHCVQLGTGRDWLVAPGVGNEADFAPLATDRRVVFFDLRNRGRSDPVPETGEVGVPIEVDDIDTVRRHLDIATIDLVGWSYVGLVAALYAARYPQHVRRLVLVCPLPLRTSTPPPAPSPEVLERIVTLAQQDLDPAERARAWRRITVPTRMGDPTAFERLRGDPSAWPNEWPDHLMAAMQRVVGSLGPDFDFRDEASRIAARTLVVAGEADVMPPVEAAREWAGTIPDAQLVVLPGVGHYPHVEAPEAFFAAVDAFLKAG